MAALELAGLGAEVLLVDRFPFPREKVCGDALLGESQKILTAAGLSAEVMKGGHRLDRIRLIAPNGSGKTTLLHIIMGLLKPLSGKLEIFGSPVREEKDFADVRRRIGLLSRPFPEFLSPCHYNRFSGLPVTG